MAGENKYRCGSHRNSLIGKIVRPYGAIVTCVAVLLFTTPAFTQQMDSFVVNTDTLSGDSLKYDLLHLFPSGKGNFKPGTDQLLKLWVIQHRSRIWEQVEISGNPGTANSVYGFADMFTGFDDAKLAYPGLEMRESSIYIPENVRDYTDYKMGRDRYLPILNPVLIGFMLYHVSRYAHEFFDREDDSNHNH